MGLRQHFRFIAKSESKVQSFLRGSNSVALVEDRGEFFVFRNRPEDPPFEFDCAIVPGGIESERSGQYFQFLGMFIEAITGEFGPVVVEDK